MSAAAGYRRRSAAMPGSQRPQPRAPRCVRVVARAADAKLAAPAQQQQQQQQEQQDHGEAQPGGRCPFLAAAQPPPSGSPWHKRLGQLFSPAEYSREALGPHAVVAEPPLLGFPKQLVVGRADLAKQVFNGEADGTTTTMSGMDGSRRLIGTENLVVVPEPRHSYLRKLVMPAFTNEAIERLVPRMTAVLGRYLESWADVGAAVKAHDELRLMTFEFIIAVVLGKDYPASELKRLGHHYATWTKGLLAWPYINLPFTAYGRALESRQALLDFFQGEIEASRREEAEGSQMPGILGSLMAAVDDDGNRLTDAELRDNMMLLMLAGHDTSSTTLTSVMVCLQENPRAMDRLREEQAALVAARGPAIDGVTLREMAYADAVVRETLRLHPVVAGLMRQSAKDFTLGGYAVPEGTPLMLPLMHLALTDPRFANDDPAAFRPERMLTPEGMKPGAQMPFGHGPRFCAGYSVAMAEMKVFLALLARGYTFQADTNTKWRREIGRVPVNGLPTTFTRVVT